MVIFVHMASVWVPFTSESKEAIAVLEKARGKFKQNFVVELFTATALLIVAAAAAIAVVFYQRETTPASAVNPTPTQNVAQVRKVPSSPIPTGREATVVVPFGAPVVQSASSVRPAFAWMKQELTAVTPLTDDDLMLVPRTDKSFSSHLNWGLHESAGFPRAGAARSPTELNAFEISK